MKTTTRLNLKGHEKKALQALKDGLTDRFPEAEMILYGSKARGNSETFSDIDVLVLLGREINNSKEFVNKGLVDKDSGRFYSEMVERRQKGDYKDFTEFAKEDVEIWLKKAEELLRKIESISLKRPDAF